MNDYRFPFYDHMLFFFFFLNSFVFHKSGIFSRDLGSENRFCVKRSLTGMVWLVCETGSISISLGLKPLPYASKQSCQDRTWLLQVQIFTFMQPSSFWSQAELDKLTHSPGTKMEADLQNDGGGERVQRRDSLTMLLITVKVIICIWHAHKLHHHWCSLAEQSPFHWGACCFGKNCSFSICLGGSCNTQDPIFMV